LEGELRLIYHIVGEEEWEEARRVGVYSPESLEEDGFIHAGYREQILDVANILFAGEEGLVVLCIEPSRVKVPIREDLVEFPEGVESLHPHFYEPLNVDAVVQVLALRPRPDGSFSLPAELEGM
jgi:uncharacterized protein (DUF952 family)